MKPTIQNKYHKPTNIRPDDYRGRSTRRIELIGWSSLAAVLAIMSAVMIFAKYPYDHSGETILDHILS